jgi:hypothetical protein
MKPKLLLLSLTFLSFQLQSKMFAQNCNDPVHDPASCIPQQEATDRMNFFAIKKIIISKMGATVNNNFSFTAAQVTDLENILQTFRSSSNNYDGIRFYFALSDNKPHGSFAANTIYLVMVPTTASSLTDINNDVVSEDDDSAYIISDGTFTPVNLTTDKYVARWINRFQHRISTQIENVYRRRYHISIDETNSLWYSKRMFFCDSTDGLGPDLLTYLQSDRTHPITQAKIEFASWFLDPNDNLSNPDDQISSQFAFKLTLVFEFDKANANPFYLTFLSKDILQAIRKSDLKNKASLINMVTSRQTYTDTGNPCPGKKCP